MLHKVASLRLHIQNDEYLTTEDERVVVEILKCSNVFEDSSLRRSLILLLESYCRQIWQSKRFLASQVEESCNVLVDSVIQRIGMHLEEMQFQDRDRWFGGLTSSVRCSLDKARIFSIITVCLALIRIEKGVISDELKIIVNRMPTLYTSLTSLANDLLNSDDRFLTTVSALLTVKADFGALPYLLILSALREIRFDSKIILAWIDNDEIGFETILMIVQTLIEDRIIWETRAVPKSAYSPSPKRSRLLSHNDDNNYDEGGEDDYHMTYLFEKPPTSDDDIVISVRIPYLEDCGGCREETFMFSRQPEIQNCCRSVNPKPSDTDLDALLEMFVEVKLNLNKRLLDAGNDIMDMTKLLSALNQLLDGEFNEDNDEECPEEDSEEEHMIRC
ncbi:hypothetical protein KIN20_005393 [Parelaphostrongylus tenuis]|uniref:Uncharacterized protein n=1 Tax=Parelaphostrongylus tenuis TaxID=148309 RepID=A0AAD5QIJ1_PARTN|nr:hypothetical protein KIN20_005393 [Parelaphostrongylus tenuis]